MSKIWVLTEAQADLINNLLIENLSLYAKADIVVIKDGVLAVTDVRQTEEVTAYARTLLEVWKIVNNQELSVVVYNGDTEEAEVYNSREHLRQVIKLENPEMSDGELTILLENGADAVIVTEVSN